MTDISDKLYPFWMRNTQRDKISQILKKFPPRGKVLDVACGPGFLEELIPDKKNIVAIDSNQEYVDEVKKKGVVARLEDANILDFPDNSFHTIYAIDIIHLLDPKKFFPRAQAVLKKQGRLLVTIFCSSENLQKKSDWLRNLVEGFTIKDEFLVKAKNEWDFCLVLESI